MSLLGRGPFEDLRCVCKVMVARSWLLQFNKDGNRETAWTPNSVLETVVILVSDLLGNELDQIIITATVVKKQLLPSLFLN